MADDLDYDGDVGLTVYDVHTASDLMLAVAQAMEDLDFDLLHQLRRKVEDWLQLRHERDAQCALIDAAEMLMDRSR